MDLAHLCPVHKSGCRCTVTSTLKKGDGIGRAAEDEEDLVSDTGYLQTIP